MLILLDQDGVLADFEEGFRSSWSELLTSFPAVPLGSRRTFRVRDDYPQRLRGQVDAIYQARGFYRGLPPISGAIEGVRAMLAAGHDVRICTSPLDLYSHCVLEKYEWVEHHLGMDFVRRMIVTKDKSVVLGDVLIDDNPDVSRTRPPVWRHVLFDQPYNRAAASPRITWANWASIESTDGSAQARRSN